MGRGGGLGRVLTAVEDAKVFIDQRLLRVLEAF